jgi:teichuronic acid exporter
MPDSSRPPEEALRGKAVSGAKWGAIASLAAFVFSFGQNIALARLLSPQDFGWAGMIWAVLGLAQLLSDAGLSGFLLFDQKADRRKVSTIFWLNALVSLLISGLLLAGIPLLVWFNREPALAAFVPWAVASFFLACLGAPLRTLAQRELHFGGLALAEIAGGGAALATAVYIAWAGGGVYALLLAGLVSAVVRLVIAAWVLRNPFPIGFLFDPSTIRKVAGFGLFQLGDRLANYLWSNLDYLLVGRSLGAGALGYYRMAYETAVRPLSVVNPIFNSVAYPLFARKQQDPEAMRRGYLDMVGLLSAIVMPMLAGLAVLAELTIETVFGAQWLPAASTVRILCLLGVLRSLQNPMGALVIACGKPATGFAYNGILLLLNLICFPIALQYGINALAGAAVFTMAISMIATWRIVYGQTIALPPADWLRRMVMPTVLSLLMALAVWALAGMLPGHLGNWIRMLILVPTGAFIYFGSYYYLDRTFVLSFVAMLRNRN